MSLLILANYHSCVKRLIKLYQSLKRFCLWCSFYCKWYLFCKTSLITTRRELYLFSSYCGSVKILRFLCLVLFLNLWNPFSLIHVRPDKVSSFSQSLPLSAIIAGTPPPTWNLQLLQKNYRGLHPYLEVVEVFQSLYSICFVRFKASCQCFAWWFKTSPTTKHNFCSTWYNPGQKEEILQLCSFHCLLASVQLVEYLHQYL